MASLLDPLLLPRLLVRALDDVHELALASRQVLDLGGRILDLGERIDRRAEAVLALGERIDRRAEAILALGGAIDGRGAELVRLGEAMQALGRDVLVSGDVIAARAQEVAERGAEITAALPLLERAVRLGEPLEGTVERLGRIVDRLPGGPAARRRAAGEQP